MNNTRVLFILFEQNVPRG